jgi:hypothetical protein
LGIVFPSFTSLPFVLFVLLLFMCFLGEWSAVKWERNSLLDLKMNTFLHKIAA